MDRKKSLIIIYSTAFVGGVIRNFYINKIKPKSLANFLIFLMFTLDIDSDLRIDKRESFLKSIKRKKFFVDKYFTLCMYRLNSNFIRIRITINQIEKCIRIL